VFRILLCFRICLANTCNVQLGGSRNAVPQHTGRPVPEFVGVFLKIAARINFVSKDFCLARAGPPGSAFARRESPRPLKSLEI
jgi:hypothetical protein